MALESLPACRRIQRKSRRNAGGNGRRMSHWAAVKDFKTKYPQERSENMDL